ncbi:MAG: hypothetical protein ACYCQJ_13980 [Nitrososphaerales archaeon]
MQKLARNSHDQRKAISTVGMILIIAIVALASFSAVFFEKESLSIGNTMSNTSSTSSALTSTTLITNQSTSATATTSSAVHDSRVPNGNGYFVPAVLINADNFTFQTLVDKLVSAKVVYLFFNLPNIEPSGYLDPALLNQTPSLIARFKNSAPGHQFIYVGWTGTQTETKPLLNDYNSDMIGLTIKGLNQSGFSALIFDPEPVPNESVQFLNLLDTIRIEINSFSPGMFLGDAAMNIIPYATVGENWSWNRGYYEAVTSRLDFVLPMLYETGFNTSQGYASWVDDRIAFNSNYSRAPVIYSLPDWYQNTTWHHPWAENLTTAILAFRAYMVVNSSVLPPSNMMGVAIYSLNGTFVGNANPMDSIETTNSDWVFFESYWSNTSFASMGRP